MSETRRDRRHQPSGIRGGLGGERALFRRDFLVRHFVVIPKPPSHRFAFRLIGLRFELRVSFFGLRHRRRGFVIDRANKASPKVDSGTLSDPGTRSGGKAVRTIDDWIARLRLAAFRDFSRVAGGPRFRRHRSQRLLTLLIGDIRRTPPARSGCASLRRFLGTTVAVEDQSASHRQRRHGANKRPCAPRR